MMKPRWLVIVLVGLIFALRAMAFASPPDPSWPGGFWDDGDLDDVIIFLTGCCPVIASPAPPDVTPVGPAVLSISADDAGSVPASVPSSHDSRAPPAS